MPQERSGTEVRNGVDRVEKPVGYGLSAAFRQGISARNLPWAVGLSKHQKVYPYDVASIFPVAGHGRPRKHSIPDTLLTAAEMTEAAAAPLSLASCSYQKACKPRQNRTMFPLLRFGGLLVADRTIEVRNTAWPALESRYR